MTRDQAIALKKRADRALELMKLIEDAKADVDLLTKGIGSCPITIEYGGVLVDGMRHPKADCGTEMAATGSLYAGIQLSLINRFNADIARYEAELKTLESE